MSRRAHRAPVALTSTGDLLLNVAMFDAPKDLESLVRLARAQPGRVFIGVVLAPDEQEFAVDELAHALRDASARMVGRRQRVPGARRDGERLAQPTSSRRPRSSP